MIAGAATGSWYALSRPTAQEPQATTQLLTLAPTTLKTTVSATGTLEPERQADLAFTSSSTVASVAVAVGDRVTAGQTLATIDDQALTVALSSAEADLAAAEETLEELEDSDDATDSAIAAAEAAIEVRTNSVTTAEDTLAAATMTAPFDGIVAEVNIGVGYTTSSGSGGSSGASDASAPGAAATSASSSSSAAIVLISGDSYTVSTSVTSADIGSITRGLQAELTVGGAATPIYGTVATVAVSATASTTGSASFPVTIDVTGTQEGLFAGSSVAVEIVTAQLTDVIAVATSAVTTTDGASTVAKLVDGVATDSPVTLGETVGSQVVITEGLAEGDQIEVAVVTPGGGRTDSGGATDEQPFGQFPDGATGGFGGGAPPGGFGGAAPDGQGGGPNR